MGIELAQDVKIRPMAYFGVRQRVHDRFSSILEAEVDLSDVDTCRNPSSARTVTLINHLPSGQPRNRFIGRILRYLEDHDCEVLRDEPLTVDAVER